ncbi:MAG: DUF938 domain-containing protein [Roseobacter sp.]|jgi:SAM-dependent methyltransferase|nr:DUF938 domain-containing protein [Roseobacter sp.]
MTRKLPETASVALPADGTKLHAPAAARNADALSALVRAWAPAEGTALELASGTGQHVTAFAAATPELLWQPSEIDDARMASIDAYAVESGLDNIRPARLIDATSTGWHEAFGGRDLVVLVNLLHLLPVSASRTVIKEAIAALAPAGRFILYGPFMRNGAFTSDGDAHFHAQLSGANPVIGYKNDTDIDRWLRDAGALRVDRVEMPANNLAFIAAL